MAQPPSLPPSGGNPEVEAINELTLQLHFLNENIANLSIFLEPDVMAYGAIVVILTFFAGFSISALLGLVRSSINHV